MTFHPRFKKAHQSHRLRTAEEQGEAVEAAKSRARTEKEVKEEYEKNKPTAQFHVGQSLKVVLVGRNTITVSYFDGRAETVTKQLEVVCDDQYPDAIDILAEGEGE